MIEITKDSKRIDFGMGCFFKGQLSDSIYQNLQFFKARIPQQVKIRSNSICTDLWLSYSRCALHYLI
jgi:hypothetical protein